MHTRSEDTGARRGIAALALFGVLAMAVPAQAADHAEAPLVRDDPAADIADVYAWHDPKRGTLTAIVTFDGFKAPAEMKKKSKKSLRAL